MAAVSAAWISLSHALLILSLVSASVSVAGRTVVLVLLDRMVSSDLVRVLPAL